MRMLKGVSIGAALFLSSGLITFASDIRMMSLGNPQLIIRDADTDWLLNPAYLMDAPNQVAGSYIGGVGSTSFSDIESHQGGAQFITSIGQGKLGIQGSYSKATEEDNSIDWKEAQENPAFFGSYALPVTSELTLAFGLGWDKPRDVVSIQDFDALYSEDYHRWNATVGLSWQPNKEWLVGFAVDGGTYVGTQGPHDSSDISGEDVRLLAHTEYHVNEQLTIPVVLQAERSRIEGNLPTSWPRSYQIQSTSWTATGKTGVNYLIDKASEFQVGVELFYTYVNETLSPFYWTEDGAHVWYSSDYERPFHTAGARLGLERKLCSKVTGRLGAYYMNTTYDDWPFSADHPAETIGFAAGFGYMPIKNLRIDIGADIPVVNDGVSFLNRGISVSDVQKRGGPLSFYSSIDEIVYRAGINVTWFF